MSKATTKSVGTGAEPASEMPFEEALKRLEAIVEAMEAEELPLETLLRKFEEGVRLSRVCQAKLAEADVRIQQLELDPTGSLALKPVATPALGETGTEL